MAEILPVWHVSLPTIGDTISKLFPGLGLFHGEIIGYYPFRDLYRLRYSDSGEEELPLSDVVLLLSTLDSRRDDNHVGALSEVAVSPGHDPDHHVGEQSVIASDATTIIALPLTVMNAGESSLSSSLSPFSPPFCPDSSTEFHATLEDHHVVSMCDVDAQCAALVGAQFLDAYGERYTVSHWDVECGTHRVWYSAASTPRETTHDVLSEVMAWVRRDAVAGSPSSATKIYWSTVGRFGLPPVPISDVNERSLKVLFSARKSSTTMSTLPRWPLPHIPLPRLRRILKAELSVFKYGVYVPRNDRDADKSPERVQWRAGRTLEWLRLLKIGAFEGTWTKESMVRAYPHVSLTDIGHVFFIYDFKHSGEFKVRLVYDGSRQPTSTYGETFAPTVQPESVRLFHLYCVEYDLDIGQYDVPQAFLQAEAEGDIFFYPPPGCATFPGQIFRCIRNLYGGKAAARIFYLKFVAFLTGTLGFVADLMDPCFLKRREPNGVLSLIICHVDDSRVGASPAVLQSLYSALFDEFGVTVADGTRFLGMDMVRTPDMLTLHMATYIRETVTRFEACDTSTCFPYREIVGCLLWACGCCHGADLMRVKALASKCNEFTGDDFAMAMKLLYRLRDRGDQGIIFRQGGAKCVRVPPNRREHCDDGTMIPYIGAEDILNEFGEKDLYRDKDDETDSTTSLSFPVSERFLLVCYTDASFATTDKMQSVSGWIVYLNGTPILWGSMRQSVVVDSTCSAEYVAASIAVKKVKELEHRLLFLEVCCPKPYTVYTDSQASQAIANNSNTLGNVRHLAIRTHLTRCYISIGDIALAFCITEAMVADLFTKIVTAAQERGLLPRFYNDCDLL